MNVIYRGQGVGAICTVCKDDACVHPQNKVDQSKVSLGKCQICGATSKVCSPEQYDGIRPELK